MIPSIFRSERSDIALLALLSGCLAGPGPLAAQVQVTVDQTALGRPIRPEIYGVNFADTGRLSTVSYPVNRWGGNATTRYNWRVDVSNRAADWFFMNIANDVVDEGDLPDGSAADRFVADSLAGASEPMLTLPLIGWTPLDDRSKRWGFSVAEYGAQDQTECTVTGNASWCQPDAGNGRASGQKVTGNDPGDTSQAIGPDFVEDWLEHLDGSGATLFSLDNEPMLWSETHFDVHPGKVSYDELWQRTVAVSAAVKAKQPQAELLGPAVWGWCAYFHSAADGCSAGPDQAAHGGQPFLEWYLDRICDYEAVHGVRLVDYLDVHYYPQGGQALSGEGSAALQALRLRSTRDLYDAGYTSESWIGQPVRLIPRLRQAIDQHCPGTRLAITEYNWGDGCTTCALAQAEVLAIFGREGVDLATRWVAPAADTLGEDAFRLFLDYDGASSRIEGRSVSATTSDVDRVGAYAVDSGDGRFMVLLFNKSTIAETVDVSGTPSALAGPVELYRFDANSRLARLSDLASSGAPLSLDLPARSASLYVFPLAGSPIFSDDFESGDATAWGP